MTDPFHGLPGTIKVDTAEDPYRDLTAVRVTQQLVTHKLAAHVCVPTELLADSAIPIQQLLADQFDRVLRPWRYPDRNPMPVIDLFPRLTTAKRWLTRHLERYRRNRKDQW